VALPLPLGEAAVRAVLWVYTHWVYFGSLSLGSICGFWVWLQCYLIGVILALWQAQRDPFRCAQRECVANGREVRGGWYA
jgi:hypothetical protein